MIIELFLEDLKLPEGVEGVILRSGAGTSSMEGSMLMESLGEALKCLDCFPPTELSASASSSLPLEGCSRLDEVPKDGTEDHKGPESSLSNLTPTSRFPHTFNTTGLVNLYNEAAQRNGWQKCVTPGVDLKRKMLTALRRHPEKSYWEKVLEGWEEDPFFSGRSGKYDRIKIITMFYSSRYEQFYEDAIANQEKKQEKDQFLSELDEFLGHK